MTWATIGMRWRIVKLCLICRKENSVGIDREVKREVFEYVLHRLILIMLAGGLIGFTLTEIFIG